MWLLLALFIIVKLVVFHKLQDLHHDLHTRKICPSGYHGLAPDPYDCDSYYVCPDKQLFYCMPGQQFDVVEQNCVPASLESGCMGRLYKSLLL
ncbi:Unknown (Ac145) [Spodoptera exigua multiple nucleopolyhedrovirus]|nr:Unknown (Ac145) [Spodoptera exigua multiple nucleopolyhedrovirus]CDG72612.1 Unknown (Ac145) [Spodoptera exigua multiple nucleopolyhedrovirus]CDG72749.1 Unknown (Ac145) [Spodoptera exigua multiple nucleopolyhedrovirus]CDG73038.1 Unknown (Ac145) [Spodoptera exigua multiple nucleopolyhedrovirus]CDG73175.1 Unknown (Ac145) [Spodoptera exigua multiple nucleopolyhedrovirus]